MKKFFNRKRPIHKKKKEKTKPDHDNTRNYKQTITNIHNKHISMSAPLDTQHPSKHGHNNHQRNTHRQSNVLISTSTITQRQLSHLNSQVAQLHANLSDFNDLVTTASEQYKNIEMLGKIHASLLMGSRKIFEEEAFDNQAEPK